MTLVQFVVLVCLQVWNITLDRANLATPLFILECYFLILYRSFEANYIICELMSTVVLSCPEGTNSEWPWNLELTVFSPSLLWWCYSLGCEWRVYLHVAFITLHSTGSVILCLWLVVSFCVKHPTAWRNFADEIKSCAHLWAPRNEVREWLILWSFNRNIIGMNLLFSV